MALDPQRLRTTQKTLDKLLEHFKGEAQMLVALDAQDVSALAQVPGISERKAVELVLAWKEKEVRDLIQSEQGQRIYESILEKILAFANTDSTRNRVRLLRPLASEAAVSEMEAFVASAKKDISPLPLDDIAKQLKRLKPLAPPKPKLDGGLCLVAESEEIYALWEAKGVSRWAYLTTPDDAPSLADYAIIVYIYDTGSVSFQGMENVVMVHANAEAYEAVPQAVIEDFKANRSVIDAVTELSKLLSRKSKAQEALDLLDSIRIKEIDPDEFESWAESTKDRLNSDIPKAIEGHSFTGAQVIGILAKDLPPQISKVYSEHFAKARLEMKERFGISNMPFKEEYPVSLDQEILSTIRHVLESVGRMEEHRAKAKAAAALSKIRRELEREVAELIEYDHKFCLGRFALAYDLSPASHKGPQFSFSHGLSLDFVQFKDPQYIDYAFGESEGERVVILTGANSGGKTSLLETLAQMTIMSCMGLPVCARAANTPLFDELYYFSPKRALDAGGFETFLKGFLPLCLNTKHARRLILADELESMTELEAASRILSTFIDEIVQNGSYGVIVTHMAKDIAKFTKARIDGIEASGLDAQFNLIVDRAPKKGHFARSTPELILKRLRASANKDMAPVLDKILARF